MLYRWTTQPTAATAARIIPDSLTEPDDLLFGDGDNAISTSSRQRPQRRIEPLDSRLQLSTTPLKYLTPLVFHFAQELSP